MYVCVNARGIVNKIDDLQALISVENPDIFGITESTPLDHRCGAVLLYVRVNTIQIHVLTSDRQAREAELTKILTFLRVGHTKVHWML